jgi:glycogen synthase
LNALWATDAANDDRTLNAPNWRVAICCDQPSTQRNSDLIVRIAAITLSALAHDSRILRASLCLARAGHKVRLIGRPPVPKIDEFDIVALLPSRGALTERLSLLARQAPATLFPSSALFLYWVSKARQTALAQILSFEPDLIIANDWVTLPIAARAKARSGARILYDSHEFAPTEFADRWMWRMFAQRHVGEIERRYIGDADAILTVSPNIAKEICSRYRLRTLPFVVRNIPDFEPVPARPTGDAVTVLFHGLFRPHRGIEALIDSVPLWRPQLSLVLRGYGAAAYVSQLEQRAKESQASSRIRFEGPVSPESVVAAAASADIGIFALPGSSPQSRFALPNKIFEYIGASLAVVTTPLTDMRALLDEWGCGAYTGETASEIAQCLNALDCNEIDRLKSRAALAARSLNWKEESKILLSAVAGLT